MNKIKLFPFVLGAISAVSLAGCGKTVEEPNPEPAHTHSYALKHDGNSHWQECTCGDKKDIAAHSFVEVSKTPATCAEPELTKYQCSVCGEQKEVLGKETLDHHYRFVETIEATCQKPGKLVYGCESCSEKKEIEIVDANAHNYGRSSKSDSVITYFCVNEGCSSSYKVIDAKTQEKATVTSKEIGEVGAIELKEATIALDPQTLLGFGKDVTIGAEKLTSEEVAQKVTMSEETKALIQDAPVFDFSAKDGEEDVHEFLGKVTITIPYELQAGEDPNGLSVAYINDVGGVEHMPATYRNGLVSFETTHFSVYALVKMSAEEACAKFGHIYSHLSTKESTCVKAGHETHVCTRCGAMEERPLPLVDHNFVFSSSKESSKYEHGYIEYKCEMCDLTKREELPLLPMEDNGFAMNLVTSLASQNMKLTEIAESNDYVDGGVLYVCLNEEKPFISSYYDNAISYYDNGVKEYTLTSEHESQLSFVKSVLANIKAAPKSVVNAVNLLADVFENTLVSKKETGTGYIISLDSNKILNKIYESAKAKDVVSMIDLIFGEGFYNKIYDLASNFAVRTVQESLNALESSLGLNVKEIWNFISAFGETDIPAYDSYFTADILNSKGSEILKMLPSEIADILGSKASLDAFIDTFKGMTIFELLDQFLHVGFAERMEELNEIVNSICSGASKLEIVTTKSGQFISGTFEADVSKINGIRGDQKIKLAIETSFDLDGVRAEGEKLVSDNLKVKNAFAPDNQAFIDNVISKIFEGVSFKYYEQYLNYPNVHVSEPTSKFNEVLNLPEGSQVEIMYWVDVYNVYKYKDLHGMFNSNNLVYANYYFHERPVHILKPDGVSEFAYSPVFNAIAGDVVFDIDSGKYYVGGCGEHLYQYKECTAEEFFGPGYNDYPHPLPYYNDEHYYIGTCVFCGKTTHTSSSIGYAGIAEGQIYSPLMDEEARKYTFDVRGLYSSDNNGIEIYVYKNYDIKFSENEKKSHNLKNEANGKDTTFTFGNVTIEYAFKPRTGYECSIVNTVTIKIDGVQIIKFSKNLHTIASTHQVETVVYSTQCEQEIRIDTICDTCGEVVESNYTYRSSHEYRQTVLFEGNQYIPGVYKITCLKCGIEFINNNPINNHELRYDPDSASYYCSECGEYMNFVEHYHFADINNVLPENIKYRDNSSDEYKYIAFETFRYYDQYNNYHFVDLSNLFNYQVSLIVAKVDGDNIDVADDGLLEITRKNNYNLGLYCLEELITSINVLKLLTKDVQQLLAVLAANEGYGLYICITDTSGTGNTFVCPFSFAS